MGSVANLISIPLAIYFWLETKEFRNLSFSVNPVRTAIVKADQTSKLSVSYDGKQIHSDITACQVGIWNQGKHAIEKADILEPITIYTENGTPILEVSIRRTSRDLTKFSLDTNDLANGRIVVSWSILEQGDGASIQFTYAGGPETNILIEGTIKGQKNLTRPKYPDRLVIPEQEYWYISTWKNEHARFFIIMGPLVVLCGIVLVAVSVHEKRFSWFYLIMIAFGFIMFGFGLYIWSSYQETAPPFSY